MLKLRMRRPAHLRAAFAGGIDEERATGNATG